MVTHSDLVKNGSVGQRNIKDIIVCGKEGGYIFELIVAVPALFLLQEKIQVSTVRALPGWSGWDWMITGEVGTQVLSCASEQESLKLLTGNG
jgi:hypothetical protein